MDVETQDFCSDSDFVEQGRKPKPGLKVDRGFNFSCIKVFLYCSCFVEFEISRRQTGNVTEKLKTKMKTHSNSWKA